MRRYQRMDLAQCGDHGTEIGALPELPVKLVDGGDQFTVLGVDRGDADLEFVFPLDQAQRNSKPPLSGLNVTVR
jgi:hypothetical protein